MDEEFREEIIPKGTQNVELFYDLLNTIDSFKFSDSPSDFRTKKEAESRRSQPPEARAKEGQENFFLQKLVQRRVDLDQERQLKEQSWLDRQPFLKINYENTSFQGSEGCESGVQQSLSSDLILPNIPSSCS